MTLTPGIKRGGQRYGRAVLLFGAADPLGGCGPGLRTALTSQQE